jgi:hypothetical protein
MAETLLRIPAAVVATTVLVISIAGDLLFGGGATPYYGALLACALPFLVPWYWFASRTASAVLLGWVTIVALAVTGRVIYVMAWLYPMRPLAIWSFLFVMFLAGVAALWLAVFAVWRRRERVRGVAV